MENRGISIFSTLSFFLLFYTLYMRTIFHIDMNAYFASVAQQANPFLRDKAIGIGGKPGMRSIIAAASQKAKKRGVKTAMSTEEALAHCPDMEIIHGDPHLYEHIAERFVAIFSRYSDCVELFSIDEAFLDVTAWVTRWGGVRTLAERIKADIAKEIGQHITCSIGVAPNKLLAKLGSDMQKPDGFVWLTKKDLPIIFAFSKLTDFLGIAERTRRRLAAQHIHTLLDLHRAQLPILTSIFGANAGLRLWLLGQGEDPSPVVATPPPPKSFGNSYTLPKNSIDIDALRKTFFALVEKATARMRSEAFLASTVSVTVRYGDFTFRDAHGRLDEASDDPLMLFRSAWSLLLPLLTRPCRLLGIHLGDLRVRNAQEHLWNKSPQRKRLLVAIDAIHERYGKNTIHAATTTGVELRRHVSGFAPR
jgi:DNA polymerase-4